MKQSNNKTIRIILTGGGTAGHIWPILAVYEEMKSLSYKYKWEFLYIGSGDDSEKELAANRKINYKSILTGKFRRYFDFRNFITPFKILVGFFQSLIILSSYSPHAIFAKGGYVTFPVVLAGWFLGVPIITHESDVVMGLANRWEARLARKICVGFPVQFYQGMPISKIVYTGNPIRKQFQQAKRSNNFNKRSDRTIGTVLITGGSQGSRFINQTVAATMGELTKKYQIIHSCGKSDYEWLVKNRWSNYKLYDFTEKLPEFMAEADLIISRAGANTLAEISYLGKPSILIPLPSAANNHQAKNAEIYQKKSAAVMVSEKGLTPENLLEIINRLMEDRALRKNLGDQAKSFSQPDAAEAIGKEIIKYVTNSTK